MSATALQIAPTGQWSRTALDLPDGLPFEDWLAVGDHLRSMEQSVWWWIGDWLLFGERQFKGLYEKLQEETGYSYSQLTDAKYIAKAYPPSERLETLPWSHHYVAAKLPQDQRREMLDRASAKGWSVRDLRVEIARYAVGIPQASEQPAPAAPAAYLPDRHARFVNKLVADAFGDWFAIGDEYARVVLGLYQAGGKPQTWRDLARFVSTHQPMTRGALHEAISTLREAFECEAIDRDDEGYWLTDIGMAECRRAFRELGAQLIGMGAEPANDSAPLISPPGSLQ